MRSDFRRCTSRVPGTDLTVGIGGRASCGLEEERRLGNGVYCQPNIPTEECFTTPHKDRVNGTVRASKPLSHQGTLIENIAVRFEDGKDRRGYGNGRRGCFEPADQHG